MPVILGLLAALIGWAMYTKRLSVAQLPPVILAMAGAALMLRGQFLIGAGALGIAATWYRGLTWRLFGLRSEQSPQYHIDKARWLLGVSAHDDAERIRARHRSLISENHPDRGGNPERAAELNKARDLLLHHLDQQSR